MMSWQELYGIGADSSSHKNKHTEINFEIIESISIGLLEACFGYWFEFKMIWQNPLYNKYPVTTDQKLQWTEL